MVRKYEVIPTTMSVVDSLILSYSIFTVKILTINELGIFFTTFFGGGLDLVNFLDFPRAQFQPY